MKHYVGLDWAKDARAVCVINPETEAVDRFDARHDRAGLAETPSLDRLYDGC